jgi:hypothetical protein
MTISCLTTTILNNMGFSKIIKRTEQGLSLGPDSVLIHGVYGIPIVCSSTKTQATIGGILHSKGIFYGLTVSHARSFGNSVHLASEDENEYYSEFQGEDSEFALDEDDEDIPDIEMSEVAITSQGMLWVFI